MRLSLAVAALLAAGCNNVELPPERLPRFEPPRAAPRVALVLGSGGPRGFAHVGVIKALEDHGVRPDIIVGSSVGAMVGALYAAGLPAAELQRLTEDLDVRRFFLEWQVLLRKPASGEAVQRYVSSRVGGRPIEALAMPFAAAATRMRDGALVLFNRGDTGLAVRASVASPEQFEPVRIGAEQYVDGDEAAPVPIRAARALGAKVVIAVDVSAYAASTPPDVPREWVAKDERRARQVAAEAPAADVLLHPDIGYYAGHDEEYRQRVMRIAESYTRERMPAILAALGRAPAGAGGPQTSSTARMPAGDASR
jgi:NTE family protein